MAKKRSPNSAYNSYKVRHNKPNKFTPKRPLMTLEEYQESRKNGKKTKAGRHLHEYSQEGTRFPYLWLYGSIEALQVKIAKLRAIGSPRAMRVANELQERVNDYAECLA